jgi:hypothetical protein
MPQLNVSEVFNSPADTLWALLKDFGNLEAWWLKDSPIKIDRIVQEGQGVGMIRHIYYVGVPTPLSERLEFMDDDSRTYRLSIVGEGVPGLVSYRAKGVVTELGADGCRLDYTAEIQATAEKEAAVEQILSFGFSQVIAGLKEATRQ